MRLALVLGVVGALLRYWSLAFLPPAALALYDARGAPASALPYAVGAVSAFAVGWAFSRLRRGAHGHFHRTEALGVVSATWAVVTASAAIPFLFAGMSFTDAYFEAMSGLTTTGASVLVDYDRDRAFFLWRSEMQWVGGLGIVALFVAVLPRLGIAGRQLFFAEATGPIDEGITPQIRRTASRLWVVYTALTAVEIALLSWHGMPLFDAVCNSFSTISSGGFSPNPRSIEGYGLPACEWVVAAFMFLAGASFSLQYRTLAGRPLALLRDPEFRLYALFGLAATGILALLLSHGGPFEGDWRQAAFQVASLQSTTGFASADFNLWSDAARGLLVAAMAFGGCAGSSGGGPKVVRWLLLARHARREVVREIHPQAVLPLRLGRQSVSDDVMRSIVMFVVVYWAVWAASSFGLVLLGSDLVTASTAALSCVANCGPGLGRVGPMASYADLPAASKWILSATMWVGRLEVVTVLAVVRWEVLRSLRWRGR
jgi:trk system potassium uptake protein TrkH